MTVEKDLPDPPGGKLICEDGQTAIVEIDGGFLIARCASPPRGVRLQMGDDFSPAFKNWLLGVVMREKRSLSSWISPEEEAILEARTYEYYHPNGNHVRVEFRPPALDTRRRGGGQRMTS